MKTLQAMIAVVAIMFTAGCKTNLHPDGVYKGDTVLYNAHKTVNSSYRILHSFVKWEYQHRAALPAEVSRAADAVRENAETSINTAHALISAYEANPTDGTRDRLETSINILQALIDQATQYMLQHQSAAPPPSRFPAPNQ